MIPSEYLSIINNIEKKYNCNEWEMSGILIWPLFRLKYTQRLHDSGLQIYSKKSNLFISTLHSIKELLNAVFRYFYAFLKDSKNNQKLEKADAIIFTNAKVRTYFNNQWYDRICDPVSDHLEKRNIKTFTFEMVHDNLYRVPRHKPSYYIQCGQYFSYLKGYLKYFINILFRKKAFDKIVFQHNFEEMTQSLKKLNLDIKIPSASEILREIYLLNALKDYYLPKLKIINPRIAFIECYYGRKQFALLLTCRELSIKTVDIQHGVQGDMHRAYGRWEKIPTNGYQLHPDWFMCWSKTDAVAINSWAKSSVNGPKTTVMGYPWISKWSQDNKSLNDTIEQIQNNRLFNTDKINVLLTLQPDAISDAQWYSKLIKNSPERIMWWIRMHQSTVHQMKAFKSNFINIDSNKFEVESATSLPLLAWIKTIDTHITKYSTCIIESSLFGVKSIVTHPFGIDMFQSYHIEGWTIPAFDQETIYNKIIQLGKTALSKKNINVVLDTLEHAIDEILTSENMLIYP